MSRPKDAVISKMTFKVMPEVCRLVDDFDDEMEATDWLNIIYKRAWFGRRWEVRYPTTMLSQTQLPFPRGIRFVPPDGYAVRCTNQTRNHQFMALDTDKHNPLEVLHILAHVLQSETGPWHGSEFSQTYFDLVERAFDKDIRRQVRDVFLKYKIKTRSSSDNAREQKRTAMLDRQATTAKDEALEMLRDLKGMGSEHGEDR